MVNDAVDHEPLHLDAVAQVLLLELSVHRVLLLPLRPLIILSFSEIDGRRLVHVVLPLVVSDLHLTVQFQLETNGTNGKL